MTAGKNSVKLAGKFVGSGVSGAVGGLIGGLTAEKGEKLSGVADGFTRGAKGIIDRRLSDKRTQRNIAKGMTEKPGVTKGIDKLAKEGETGVSTTSETVKKENNPVIEKPNGGKVNTAQGNDVSETVSTELAPAGESELEKESRVKRLDNLPEGIKADNLLVAQINNLSKTDVDAKTEILSESTVSSDVYSSNSITSSRASDSTTIVDTNVNSATQNNVIYHGSQGRVVGRSESVSSDDVDLSSMRPHAGIPDIEAPFVSSRTQDISKSETATAFDAEENDNRVSNNNRLDYIESEDISSFTTDSSDMTSQVKSRVQSQGKSDTDTTVIPNTSYTVISSDDV